MKSEVVGFAGRPTHESTSHFLSPIVVARRSSQELDQRLVLGVGCGFSATGDLKTLGIASAPVAFLYFAFWFSARMQRELGVRRLAAQVCPVCGIQIGKEASSMAFADYTQSSSQFIQECKVRGAWFIEPASPLGFACQGCSRHLYFDYLDSAVLSSIEDEEALTLDLGTTSNI
jgi:hypothetical protein